MYQQLYYRPNGGGTAVGPVSAVELKRLSEAGRLLPTDLVWVDGADKKVPAGEVKGLFPAEPVLPVAVPENPYPRVAAPRPATPAPQGTPPSPRRRVLGQLSRSFREVVSGMRAVPALAAAVPDLDHVEGRVAGAEAMADNLHRQVQEIDDRSRRYEELTRRRADSQDAVAVVEKKLLDHAGELGAAAIAAHKAGSLIGVDFDSSTSALLDGCFETDRHLIGMQAKCDDLGKVTGMLAKVKAKAEQAVLWGRIKLEERTLAGKTKQLGEHVLRAGIEDRFRSPGAAGVLGRVAAARSEAAEHRDGVGVAEADLQHPDFAGASEFPARRAECERLLDGQEAVRVNGYMYLARRCRAALPGKDVGDGLSAPLAGLEAGLSSLEKLDNERQTTGLPVWISYKFDQIEQQHVWTAKVSDDAPVGFGLRRVRKDGADRTDLVVAYKNTGMGVKVGPIPGQFGTGSDMLRIAQGESFKLRVGDRAVSLRTAGKPKVQKARVQMGLVNTDTTTEEQTYAISPDQLVVLASATSPILYRLEGGTDVEGQFAAAAVAPRLREWVDRLQVRRMVVAHLFAPPKPPGAPAGGSVPNDRHPADVPTEGAGRGSGLAAGLVGAAAGVAVGAVVAGALTGSEASASPTTTASGTAAGDQGVLLDTDGDGRADAVGLDTNGDGRIDTVGVDTDGDGRVDMVGMDTDHDGRLDTYGADADGDGRVDAVGVDVDQDGTVDAIGVDTDADGDIDFVESEPDDGDFDDDGGDF